MYLRGTFITKFVGSRVALKSVCHNGQFPIFQFGWRKPLLVNASTNRAPLTAVKRGFIYSWLNPITAEVKLSGVKKHPLL